MGGAGESFGKGWVGLAVLLMGASFGAPLSDMAIQIDLFVL